ncbi:hypothetical protein PR202_ga18843 [Eleusine coracana subsp. coracana]|uniref:Uncharacterized protein n=1 Tax=Eleusine coracana subsp. coracana TaxID=191504 RepID=A0AAV5CUE7_ELECO|nr:hypothetical protein PR202_ga18843 [Eleusine coracana subsp. coracana]
MVDAGNASGLAPPRTTALCPRTHGAPRPVLLRSVQPVVLPPSRLRCCASTVDDGAVSAAASNPIRQCLFGRWEILSDFVVFLYQGSHCMTILVLTQLS